jgi:hypothetical protein
MRSSRAGPADRRRNRSYGWRAPFSAEQAQRGRSSGAGGSSLQRRRRATCRFADLPRLKEGAADVAVGTRAGHPAVEHKATRSGSRRASASSLLLRPSSLQRRRVELNASVGADQLAVAQAGPGSPRVGTLLELDLDFGHAQVAAAAAGDLEYARLGVERARAGRVRQRDCRGGHRVK